jgi:SAM-dependent methyltransferase
MSESKCNPDGEDIRDVVRRKYGAAALTVMNGQGPASRGDAAAQGGSRCCSDAITDSLYDAAEAAQIPEDALLASLGCGNPTALARLNPGEIVLDLGSGGGIDVILSAKRVGPEGFAYGLDMTDEMLALAEKNKAEAGARNVKFLQGHIEDIPLPDSSIDVVISNCVINLSADKDRVLREAFRVLKPGGRFAVSDVVVEGELPDAVRKDMTSYVGCVAGALERTDYLARLTRAGFIDTGIEPTRRYMFADLDGSGCCANSIKSLSDEDKAALDGRIMGAFIRAVKPKTQDCCGPEGNIHV